jgi:spermidine synthase
LGSVTGALLAGFVLIPHFGLRASTWSVAAVLVATGAAGLLWRRRASAAMAAVALTLAAAAMQPARRANAAVIAQEESLYGHLKVVQEGSVRTLLINGFENSDIDLATGDTDFEYAFALEAAAAMRPQAKRALLIGLGGGSVSTLLEKRHGLIVDAVEIDPSIVRIAKTQFQYAPRGAVTVGDGRAFVSRTKEKYALVFLDAYNADQVPAHLLSREFFTDLRRVLNPNAVVAINFLRKTGGTGEPEPWECLYKTVNAAFPNVRTFSLLFPATDGVALGHAFFFASDGGVTPPTPSSATPSNVADVWARVFSRELTLSPERAAQVPLLTDDYNPIDTLIAPIMLTHRRHLMQTEPDLLLD